MLARVGEVIAEIKNNPPPLPVDEIAEATQFLEWLVANNFTFLGVREYALTGDEQRLRADLRDAGSASCARPTCRCCAAAASWSRSRRRSWSSCSEPKPLIITKANVRSRVHRRVHMDYIGVKRFDADGQLIGEFRIVGLFTSHGLYALDRARSRICGARSTP